MNLTPLLETATSVELRGPIGRYRLSAEGVDRDTSFDDSDRLLALVKAQTQPGAEIIDNRDPDYADRLYRQMQNQTRGLSPAM